MHKQVTKNFTNNNININLLASACHKKKHFFLLILLKNILSLLYTISSLRHNLKQKSIYNLMY